MNNEIKLAHVIGHSIDTKLYREDPTLASNNDAVGVELELENIHYFHARKEMPVIFDLWRAVEDGSLRDGTEFIFREPLKGANISTALDKMQAFLDVYRRKDKPVLISERCSVHVHLDVRDFDGAELNNLILVYQLVERVLFYHINPLRLKNNYCRPLTDSDFKHTVKNLISLSKDNKNLPSLVHLVKKDCDKYSALNVLPITNYGSVEFRHHHGTTDMKAVKDWINIILTLKKISKEYPIEELINVYHKKGYLKLIKLIFKDTVLDNDTYLETLPELESLIAKGVSDIKEILDYDKLNLISRDKPKSRVRPENTLLHQFKKANNLLIEQAAGASSSYDFVS